MLSKVVEVILYAVIGGCTRESVLAGARDVIEEESIDRMTLMREGCSEWLSITI